MATIPAAPVLAIAACAAAVLLCAEARAQDTLDLGLPPPSGSQNPVLPPPSGSQNPVLPPPSGQRYRPGIGGPFGGNDDIPGANPRRVGPPPGSSGGGQGVVGSLSPVTPIFSGPELDRLSDVAPALRRCWSPPPMDGPSAGAMATVRFSLRRDGTLFGQPRVAWETRGGDQSLRRSFTESVVAAVRACTPMRLSPALGAAIAGRPMTIRFHGRAPSTERPI